MRSSNYNNYNEKDLDYLQELYPDMSQANLVSILQSRKGDLKSTVDFIENMVKFDPQVNDILTNDKILSDFHEGETEEQVTKIIKMANVMLEKGEISGARKQLNFSLELINKGSGMTEESINDYTIDIQIVYLHIAKMEDDKDLMMKILILLEKLCMKSKTHKKSLGMVYNNFGLFYRNKSLDKFSLKKAEGYYLKGYKEFKMNKDEFGQAKILNNLGTLYRLEEKYEKSIKFLVKAYLLRVKIKDHYGQANSLFNIIMVHEELQNYEKCIEFFPILEKMYEKLGDHERKKVVGKTYISFLFKYINHLKEIQKQTEHEKEIGEKWEMILHKMKKLVLYYGEEQTQEKVDFENTTNEKLICKRERKGYIDLLSHLQMVFSHPALNTVECAKIKKEHELNHAILSFSALVDYYFNRKYYIQAFQLIEFIESIKLGRKSFIVSYPFISKDFKCDGIVYFSQVYHDGIEFLYCFGIIKSEQKTPVFNYSNRISVEDFYNEFEKFNRITMFNNCIENIKSREKNTNFIISSNGTCINKVNFSMLENEKGEKILDFCNFFQSFSLGYLKINQIKFERRAIFKRERSIIILSTPKVLLTKEIVYNFNQASRKVYNFQMDTDYNDFIRFITLVSSNARYHQSLAQVYVVMIENFHTFLEKQTELKKTFEKFSTNEASCIKLMFVNLKDLYSKERKDKEYEVEKIIRDFFLSICDNLIIFTFSPEDKLVMKTISIFTQHFFFADGFNPVKSRRMVLKELKKQYSFDSGFHLYEKILGDFRIYSKDINICANFCSM